jgi:hypothetical protein
MAKQVSFFGIVLKAEYQCFAKTYTAQNQKK